MISPVEKLVVTCDHCGETAELVFNDGPSINVEREFMSDLEDEGWEKADHGYRMACPNCTLEEPFQKDYVNIKSTVDFKDEYKDENFQENEYDVDFTARSTGAFFYPSSEHSSAQYIEIERKSDGEKFWIGV